MAIQTTVYDANNAISTGFYHTYKGHKVPYEFIGSEQECMHAIKCLRHDQDDHEVVHVIVRKTFNAMHAVPVGFALGSMWNSPIV